MGATDAGLKFVSHSGAFMLGAATCFMLMPSLDAAVVVLTNGIPIGIPETLCRQFVDLMENGRLTQDWWTLYSEKSPLDGAYRLPAAAEAPPRRCRPPLQRYVGVYDNAYYGPLQISVANDKLQLSIGPQPQSYILQHWSGTQFSFVPGNERRPRSISLAVFEAGDAGPAQNIWLEFYDDEGQGLFTRRL